jgi:hypothetical protein
MTQCEHRHNQRSTGSTLCRFRWLWSHARTLVLNAQFVLFVALVVAVITVLHYCSIIVIRFSQTPLGLVIGCFVGWTLDLRVGA